MRAYGAILFLFLAACGGDEGDSGSTNSRAFTASDGFLRYLPEAPQLVARLPSVERIEEAPTAVGKLLHCLGHGASDSAELLYRAAKLGGIDTARAAGFVALPGGAWIHYLPAADKSLLNQALADLVTKFALQEEEGWIAVSAPGAKPGRVEGEPLPRGDVAGRWLHHPLLDAVAQPGDRLELGGTLLDGGIEISGRLIPGNNSPTAEAVAQAGGELAGHIDLLPAWLGVRFESTLPSTIYATLLTRRIARHAGLATGELRDNLERFLREAATAIDPATGLAVGIEFRDGSASFVAVGTIADGPPSPVLAKLLKSGRTTFGGLVLDEREAKKGLTGFYAWCPQPEPQMDLPDSLATVLDNLLREDAGVLVLEQLRRRGGEGCILATIVSGAGLSGMAKTDRDRLRAMFHAGEEAVAPKLIVLAGFRRDAGELHLEGRVVYR